MLTTAKSSNKIAKQLTALGLLMATVVGGTAIFQADVNAQSKPDVLLYPGANFQGKPVPYSSKQNNLGSFNNKASSIKILNNQKWRFWSNKNLKGKSITLAPGNYPNIHLNNNIESLEGLK